jgi:tRNA nucleotidyltransferase (CCA-adding enzyme)
MNIDKFDFSKIIKKIEFSEYELSEIRKEVNGFQERLKKGVGKQAEVFIGGSYAKGTMLKKGKIDIDVFVIFPEDKGDLSEKLRKFLTRAGFKFSTIHGSRDYFQVNVKGITFEIVPIFKIKKAEQSKNITDISPLHVKWLIGKIKKKPNIPKEIILSKIFCYSQNCYGAESYISGFSGYALEVLTVYYKSFMNFLKQASKWDLKTKIIIDPEKYYKNKDEILREINKAKQEGPLILIDPVQKERNVCAALNKKTLENFVKTAKSFLRNASYTYFEKKPIDFERWKKKEGFFIIKATTLKKKTDIAGAKLKKFLDFIDYESYKNGFKIIKKEIDFDEEELEAKFYVLVEKCDEMLVKGPPTNLDKKHILAFKKKWKNAFEKQGKLFAKMPCKFKNFEDFMRNLKKSPIIKQMKIKDFEILK